MRSSCRPIYACAKRDRFAGKLVARELVIALDRAGDEAW